MLRSKFGNHDCCGAFLSRGIWGGALVRLPMPHKTLYYE